MSYKVLYRKYRPSKFEDIIDQKFITDTLKESIISNKISHAYIFSGPKGTGKTSTARVFARAINCENPIDGEPCGKCDSCLNFESNPDVIELDAASNNKVEDIREIVNSVKLSPNNSKFKVYIIDEVHMLTNSASNAFLLTLEEPPAHAVFILATTNPESLPKTILSRCQQFAFSKISKKALINRIKYVLNQEKIQMSEDIIEEIASLSDGGLRDALSILDQLVTLNKTITMDILTEQFGIVSEKSVSDLIEAIINNDIEEVRNSFNKFKEFGINEKSFVSKFIELLTTKICELKEQNNDECVRILKNIIFEIIKIDYLKTNFDFYDIIEVVVITNLVNKQEKIISQEIKPKKSDDDVPQETTKTGVISNQDETCLTKIEKNTDIEKQTLSSESDQEPKQDSLLKVNNTIIDIRINNSFCNASMQLKKELKNNFADISGKIKNNNELYSLFVDLDVGVVSPTNVLFVTETEATANLLNENENVIEEALELNKKLVFVDKKSWENITDEFKKNKSTKKYNYVEEPMLEAIDPFENMAKEIFGNNIVMEEE